MVKYKEYKGRYVAWAAHGTKGRGKPTGRILDLPDRKPRVWYSWDPKTGKQLPNNVTLSYKRVQAVSKVKKKMNKNRKNPIQKLIENELRF